MLSLFISVTSLPAQPTKVCKVLDIEKGVSMNKVVAAFFSFVEVTDPNEHVSYNEWHMLDHVPENLALPGVCHGQRWVSTPACRAEREVAAPELENVHYIQQYFFTNPIEKTVAEFIDLGAQTTAMGARRFHQYRTANLLGVHQWVKAYVAPEALVHEYAIPYRPNRGAYVHVCEVTDTDQFDLLSAWYDEFFIPSIVAIEGVAGAWWFTSRESNQRSPVDKERIILVFYLDGDPVEVTRSIKASMQQWDKQGKVINAYKTAIEPLYIGPLETITPWQWDWFNQE